MSSPADYLRDAAESDITAEEAWEEQQRLNPSIDLLSEMASPSEIDDNADEPPLPADSNILEYGLSE